MSQDESHLLKNPKAKVTEVAQKLAAKAKRVVLLTGTPALSRPLELFTQLQMIDNNIFTYRSYSWVNLDLNSLNRSPDFSISPQRLVIVLVNRRSSDGMLPVSPI